MKAGTLQVSTVLSDLVGRRVERDPAREILQSEGSRDSAWPVNEPNASGEHLATIHAVWIDKEGHLIALAVTPKGVPFNVYITQGICRLLPERLGH